MRSLINSVYSKYTNREIFELCKTDCTYDELTKDEEQYRDACCRYTNLTTGTKYKYNLLYSEWYIIGTVNDKYAYHILEAMDQETNANHEYFIEKRKDKERQKQRQIKKDIEKKQDLENKYNLYSLFREKFGFELDECKFVKEYSLWREYSHTADPSLPATTYKFLPNQRKWLID